MKKRIILIGIPVLILIYAGCLFWARAIHTSPTEVATIRSNGNDYPAVLAADPLGEADPWGMGARGCESYVAWKVYENYDDLPTSMYHASAMNWPTLAQSSGFNVSPVPAQGTVAIAQPGTVLDLINMDTSTKQYTSVVGTGGHAMWVQAVNSNGTILVSQYNAGNTGQFSYSTIQSTGLQFIYFNERAK